MQHPTALPALLSHPSLASLSPFTHELVLPQQHPLPFVLSTYLSFPALLSVSFPCFPISSCPQPHLTLPASFTLCSLYLPTYLSLPAHLTHPSLAFLSLLLTHRSSYLNQHPLAITLPCVLSIYQTTLPPYLSLSALLLAFSIRSYKPNLILCLFVWPVCQPTNQACLSPLPPSAPLPTVTCLPRP